MKKRILSLALAVVLALTAVPMAAIAAFAWTDPTPLPGGSGSTEDYSGLYAATGALVDEWNFMGVGEGDFSVARDGTLRIGDKPFTVKSTSGPYMISGVILGDYTFSEGMRVTKLAPDAYTVDREGTVLYFLADAEGNPVRDVADNATSKTAGKYIRAELDRAGNPIVPAGVSG